MYTAVFDAKENTANKNTGKTCIRRYMYYIQLSHHAWRICQISWVGCCIFFMVWYSTLRTALFWYIELENSLKKAHALIGDTELVRTFDIVMARAKRIYILIIKVNKLFSFFSSRCFLKEIENMYSVFLSSYTNTRESLAKLEKAVETLACGSCSHSISRSPKLPLVFVTR